MQRISQWRKHHNTFWDTIGNDLTARLFQDPKKGGGQYSFAKSFDNFAPLGPVIVNGEHFGSWDEKTLKTAVNGRIVQDSALDLIWGPAELVSFLSQGRTLPAHTAIMTGTPSGVGWFQKPQYSLKDGDVVDISIEGIGTLSNTMRYE
jgi:2-keto-4-pentenoate hydratase/2-oxohepta-3-ene-1,7-dioic acid hydratase in catechol pathway